MPLQWLSQLELEFVCGVPCSRLGKLINWAAHATQAVTAVNEGDAVAACARQLEVDLVFKEDRGLAQQTCGNCAQYADVKQLAETLMVGLKVLQACENALVGLGHVIFVVFHPRARGVGPCLNLVGPSLQLREPIARKQAGNQGVSM